MYLTAPLFGMRECDVLDRSDGGLTTGSNVTGNCGSGSYRIASVDASKKASCSTCIFSSGSEPVVAADSHEADASSHHSYFVSLPPRAANAQLQRSTSTL